MIILTHEIIQKVEDHYAFTVLVKSLAYRASYENKSCFPTLKQISKDCGFSVSTVKRALNYLYLIKIIKIVNRKKAGTQENTSNLYIINTDLISIAGKLKIEGDIQEEVGSDRTDLGSDRTEGGFSESQKPQAQLTTSKLNIKEKNKKEIEDFFEKENIHEIIKNFYPGEETQIYNEQQAKALLDYLKERMLEYYTVEKTKKEIKNIKMTFKDWLSKIPKNKFYSYKKTGKYSEAEQTYQKVNTEIQKQKDLEAKEYEKPSEKIVDTDSQRKIELENQMFVTKVNEIKKQLENQIFDFSKLPSICLKLIKTAKNNDIKAKIIAGYIQNI